MNKVKVSDIKENPKNPRFIKNDKLKKLMASIEGFPEMLELRPIVLNKDYVVLGGNMRLQACKKLGIEEVSCIIAEGLTEAQEDEFVIKDNASNGEWDWNTLLDNWDRGLLEEWCLDVPDEKLDEKGIDGKYNNDNCVYPIIPVFDEKYNAFIIICESETEEAAIRTKFGFPQKAQSYKNKFLGKSYILTAKEILK
jgi:hypothetical protein